MKNTLSRERSKYFLNLQLYKNFVNADAKLLFLEPILFFFLFVFYGNKQNKTNNNNKCIYGFKYFSFKMLFMQEKRLKKKQ